jgi:hypothetical protein
LKIVVLGRQEALMQEARVKKLWAILLFFTQIGLIVFTYLELKQALMGIKERKFNNLQF